MRVEADRADEGHGAEGEGLDVHTRGLLGHQIALFNSIDVHWKSLDPDDPQYKTGISKKII